VYALLDCGEEYTSYQWRRMKLAVTGVLQCVRNRGHCIGFNGNCAHMLYEPHIPCFDFVLVYRQGRKMNSYARMYTPVVKTDLVDLFNALADRTRLRLLNLMSGGEVCVCYFVELLDEPQPKISRHLAYLRRVGLVAARREGKWMHYRLVTPADPAQARLLECALGAASEDRQMQRDRERFARVCCALRLPEPLQHAPRPHLEGRTD
jgi:ArsR family transcriptional regulator